MPDEIIEGAPPVIEDAPEGAVQDAKAEPEPTPAALTREDIQSVFKQELETLAKSAAPAPTPSATWDPTAEAVEVSDMRSDMYEEALDIIKDLPQEFKQEVKQQIRSLKTLDQVKGFKSQNAHIILANAALGKAVREGKYELGGGKAPSRTPVYSEPIETVASGTKAEEEELQRILGITLSPEELKAGRNLR